MKDLVVDFVNWKIRQAEEAAFQAGWDAGLAACRTETVLDQTETVIDDEWAK